MVDVRHVSVSLDPFTWGKVVAVLEEAGYDGLADEVEGQVAPLFDDDDGGIRR